MRSDKPMAGELPRVLIQAVTVPSRERVAVECELT